MGNIADISEVLLDLGLSSSVTDEERAVADIAIKRAEGAVARYIGYDPVRRERTEYYPRMDLSNQASAVVWEVNDHSAYQRQFADAVSMELQIQCLPVRSIANVWIDYDGRFGTRSGSFDSDSLKTAGEDYWPDYDGLDDDGNGICMDGIIRSQGLWPTTPGSVKITYTAGYSAAEFHGQKQLVDASPILESVVAEACRRVKKMMAWKKQTGAGWASGPVTNESLGDYSYGTDGSALARLMGGQWDLIEETKERLSDYINMGAKLAE